MSAAEQEQREQRRIDKVARREQREQRLLAEQPRLVAAVDAIKKKREALGVVVGSWWKPKGGKVRVFTNKRGGQKMNVGTFTLKTVEDGRAEAMLDAQIAYGDEYVSALTKWSYDERNVGKTPTNNDMAAWKARAMIAHARVLRERKHSASGVGTVEPLDVDPTCLAKSPLSAGVAAAAAAVSSRKRCKIDVGMV